MREERVSRTIRRVTAGGVPAKWGSLVAQGTRPEGVKGSGYRGMLLGEKRRRCVSKPGEKTALSFRVRAAGWQS